MKKNFVFYLRLFASTLSFSVFTFGGGYVMIPMMRRRFVVQYKWLEESEMADIAAISQSSPGAVAVNASVLIGYRLAGIGGALLTALATVLPPLVILSLISLFYTAFRESQTVRSVLWGIQAAVGAVILDIVFTLAAEELRDRRAVPAVLMALAFGASFFLHINAILILLTCGAAGAAVHCIQIHRKRKRT